MELKKKLTSFGSIIRKPTTRQPNSSSDADSPEGNITRGVKQFCESAAANSGEEVLHLPTIVDAAVASPSAAQAAATQIRKYLSKENYSKPHVQYNAVMLIRILSDNPGPSFTKNLDKPFADTIKHLLRNGHDPSVAQIVKETLDSMEREKAYDTNLNTLFAMWRKEKGLMANASKSFGPRTLHAPAWNGQPMQGGFGSGGGSGSRGLPSQAELAGRIEEARTSAKLLLQLVQSTPADELLSNDLVKEFSERCMSAQRSIQGYINCENPSPDDDTMLTLIETTEQLSLAASKHQRAVLQARRLLGPSPSPPVTHSNSNPMPPVAAPAPVHAYPPPSQAPAQAPLLPPVDVGSHQQSLPVKSTQYKSDLPLPPALQAGGNRNSRVPAAASDDDNPFADHHSPTYSAPPGPPPSHENQGPTNGYGYQPTSSYLGRQESSGNNLTMHGGVQNSEDEDREQGNGPRTPEQTGRRSDSEVSPIAERAPVTYRY